MNKNCFETLVSKLSEELEEFEGKNLEENIFELKSQTKSYKIKFEKTKKVILLLEISENSEKTVSSWMFNEENMSPKDLKMIISDFKEIINKKPKLNNFKNKKKKKEEESNITGLFFANRMVNIFPDLKDDIQIEKTYYSEFRTATFTQEKILPKINNLLNNFKTQMPEIKRFAKLLSDLYSNATLDVRSIITMGILNKCENFEILKENISPELKKASEYAFKYKNKKIKPEKQKKKSFMSKALEYQHQLENNK